MWLQHGWDEGLIPCLGRAGAAGSAPTRGGERAQQAAPLQRGGERAQQAAPLHVAESGRSRQRPYTWRRAGAAGSAPTDRWGAWQPLNQIRRDGEQARGDEEERVSGWSAEADA